MISEKIGIDDIDCRIMDLIQREPNLTHTEIAHYVNRSQPTVGMRIKKLENLGVLKYQAGINIKVADLCFARVELQTKNPRKVIEIVKKCPFMLNAFRLSGESNMSILMIGLSLKDLDYVVNRHFRNDSEVCDVHIDVISDVVNDFVLPIDLNLEFGNLNLKATCCEKCNC
ncbi:MAG: Lrp/AsnC family transcriptional regulator [Promethearchaeota archaeon]